MDSEPTKEEYLKMLTLLPTIGKKKALKLYDKGYRNFVQIANIIRTNPKLLETIYGIGPLIVNRIREKVFALAELPPEEIKQMITKKARGYSTDGTSHRSGVSNEKQCIKYFNLSNSNPIKKFLQQDNDVEQLTLVHVGGTKTIVDASCSENPEIKLSMKLKKTLNGSFDLMNKSSLISEKHKQQLKQVQKSYRDKVNAIKTDDPNWNSCINQWLKELREEVDKIIENIFKQHFRSSENIRQLLEATKEHCNDAQYLYLNVLPNNTIYLIQEEELEKIFGTQEKDTEYSLPVPKKKLQKSFSILKKTSTSSEQGDVNIGFRIRIALNNGIGCLLGVKKKDDNTYRKIQQTDKNKTSILCIKIQVDDWGQLCELPTTIKWCYK